MFELMMTPRSPFARRVKLALLRFQLPFEGLEVNLFEPTPEFLESNPLGLVPVLRGRENGTPWCLIDSNTILEFLNEQPGVKIWDQQGATRAVREGSSLAVGVMTASVAFFLETTKHSPPDAEWASDYEQTVVRALDRLNVLASQISIWVDDVGQLTQAGWDLGVALEYADLRLPHLNWRERFKKLIPILGLCEQHRDFVDTRPPAMP